MRFSLKTLLVSFTAIAVSIAGVRFANPVWGSCFYTVAFVLVLTGIVGALVRRGPARPFWIGFAVFGTGYFLLALVGEVALAQIVADFRQMRPEPKLPTTRLLTWAEPYLRSTPGMNPNTNLIRRGIIVPVANGDYIEVGHSILTVIFALVGGWVGWLFSRVRTAEEPEPRSVET